MVSSASDGSLADAGMFEQRKILNQKRIIFLSTFTGKYSWHRRFVDVCCGGSFFLPCLPESPKLLHRCSIRSWAPLARQDVKRCWPDQFTSYELEGGGVHEMCSCLLRISLEMKYRLNITDHGGIVYLPAHTCVTK